MKAAAFFHLFRVVLVVIGLGSAGVARAQELWRVGVRGVVVEMHGVSRGLSGEAMRVIEDQLRLAGDSSVSAPLADDLAYFLRGRYFQLGYSEAAVDWELTGRKILLTVNEGARMTIGTVRFEGVDEIPAGELAAYLTRPTRERAGRLTRALPLVEADVRAGVELVRRHLRALGYLEATAQAPEFTPAPSGGAMDIRVVVTPGARSLFGDVRLAGDLSVVSERLRAEARALSGQPFSEVALETARGQLKGGLQEQGYFAAEVEAESGETGGAGEPGGSAGRVPVVLTVVPGPRYAVRAVRVDEGLSRGATRVAGAVFAVARGQTFSPDAVDLLHRRALDTGLFSRLEVDPVVAGDGALELRVSGEEAAPRTLGLYGGYESLFGPILGLEVRHVNYLDLGDAVALRGEFRGTGGEGALEWADPAIFGSRWSLGSGVSWESFTFADYDRRTAGWRTALTRRLTRRITVEASTALTDNKMSTDVLSPAELGPSEYTTAAGGLRVVLDYRDHPLLPRRGWMAEMAVEGGGIDGDERITFVRGELAVGWYQPLPGRWQFSLGARARAMATAAEAAAVPIDQRVFNGGANSVRSFAERDLGPMSAEGNTPLGGLASGVVSAELAFEVIGNLELAGFADAGTIGDDLSAFFGADDLRYGVGLGLRYRLPVGPLRIDYGVNPDRRDGEAFGALHVTFGFAF